MTDIIGIGALNVDFIATREKLVGLQPDLIPELSSRFEHGVELKVDDNEIEETLGQMGTGTFEVFLGGSSFNTIHAIAHTNPGLRIGYVGVAGSAEPATRSFIEAMEALRIDTRFVLSRDDIAAGRCISYVSEGERSLLTSPGANTAFADFIYQNEEPLLDYIASAKLIHVTSLFDPVSPRLIGELLSEAKARNPWLKISLDPGHEWISSREEGMFELLKVADYVFLNNREFLLLGHHRPGTSTIQVTRQIFRLCNASSVLVVLKKYDSITIYYKLQGRIISRVFPNQVLAPELIEDATGAGDIFAAGFLTSILVPGMECSHGVELGLRFVHSKLVVPGYKSFSKYAGIFSSLIDEIASFPHIQSDDISSTDKPQSVFIGHGHSPLWAIVEHHLRETHALNCEIWENQSRTSQHVVNILNQMLNVATFAVIIATADDETKEGLPRARQNVLHEIGLFQGRLGFNRVVLMMQENIEEFSNMAGLQVIRFSDNHIEQGFYELDSVLRREKVITQHN
ncbi:MAG: hypothetical protein F6K00_31545 [Leptolyngbya sp. SIOISBB]|nr:hypothetical protein [Leptolyngbya sp. SIOISBB]